MSGHFIQKCRGCKTVISQCRCPATLNPKPEQWGWCVKCRPPGTGPGLPDAVLPLSLEEQRALVNAVGFLTAHAFEASKAALLMMHPATPMTGDALELGEDIETLDRINAKLMEISKRLGK